MFDTIHPLPYMVLNLMIDSVYDPPIPMLEPISKFSLIGVSIIFGNFPANALFHIVFVYLTLKPVQIFEFKLLVVSLELKLEVLTNGVFLRTLAIFVILGTFYQIR